VVRGKLFIFIRVIRGKFFSLAPAPNSCYYKKKEEPMGFVETEITLINVKDEVRAEDGNISIDKVRKETVQATVDTGAMSLILTEELYQKLGLSQTGVINANLADGRRLPCIVTSDVRILCNKRRAVIEAVVIPGAKKVLLGVLPLESMDLTIDPKRQTLVGVHGDEVVCTAY
jgi:clan AA aspartic protease